MVIRKCVWAGPGMLAFWESREGCRCATVWTVWKEWCDGLVSIEWKSGFPCQAL